MPRLWWWPSVAPGTAGWPLPEDTGGDWGHVTGPGSCLDGSTETEPGVTSGANTPESAAPSLAPYVVGH